MVADFKTSFADRMVGALQGKVAIVTGAGRGCGRAIAMGLAKAGAQVCCIARSRAEIEGAAKEINGQGGRAIAVRADVSDYDNVEAAITQAANTFGGVDIIVLSHGILAGAGLVEISDPKAWKQTVDINLVGTYYCVRAAVPHLKARGAGKIIIVGSGQGHRGSPGVSAYASSKSGLLGFMQSVASELIEFSISVNELLPGSVKTKLFDVAAPVRPNEWVKEPEDIAPIAVFMACQPDIGPTAQTFSLMRRI